AVALVGPHALPRGVPHDTTPPSLQPDEGEEAEDIMLRATKDMGYELKFSVERGIRELHVRHGTGNAVVYPDLPIWG
ncbi:unnamed protein product, partial [Ascophyllum nodosum]